MIFEVEDESFYVSQTFVENPQFMVSGCDVVQDANDEIPFDRFSAAGSILNWVANQQAQGCQIQFRDVHRLVAAFFGVIGINEHARIMIRSN